MIAAGLGFWLVLQSVDERRSYLAAARTIERSEILTAADLLVVEANVGAAVAMPPSQANAVVGLEATGRIPQGTLITPGMFAASALSGGVEAGRVVIQVSLPFNEVAYGTLEAGDTVALIGREGSFDPSGDAVGGDGFGERVLLGILTIETVQDGSLYYVTEPARAVDIQQLVRRYLAASDREMWKLGADVTADDVARALGTAAG